MKYVWLVAVLPLLLGLILPACGGEDATPTRRLASAPRQSPAPSATVFPAAEPTVAANVVAASSVDPVFADPAEATAVPTAVGPTPVPTLPGAGASTALVTTVPEPAAAGGPGLLVPISVMKSESLRAALSAEELVCLETRGLGAALESPLAATAEQQTAVMACLEDETVLRLFLGGVTGGLEELSLETSGCVRRGTAGLDLRSVITAGLQGDEQSALSGGMAGLLVVVSCLSDEEFAVAAPALGMAPGEQEAHSCIVEALGGVQELVAILAEGEGGMLALMGAVAFCGLNPGSIAPGG